MSDYARAALAMLAGAIVAVITFALLLGLGYLLGLIAVSGAPPSELARRVLLWSGPVAILAAAAGGYLGARLAGGTMGRLVIAGGLSALIAVLLVVVLIDGIAGGAFDFHSLAISLRFIEPARLAAEAVPTAVSGSLSTDAGVVEVAEIAQRRTIKAVGWLAMFSILLMVAGALGGWVRFLQDYDPDAARDGRNNDDATRPASAGFGNAATR